MFHAPQFLPLTTTTRTVAVDKQAMGRVAVTMLMHRIRYPADPALTVVQPVELVVRESATVPATR